MTSKATLAERAREAFQVVLQEDSAIVRFTRHIASRRGRRAAFSISHRQKMPRQRAARGLPRVRHRSGVASTQQAASIPR